jgi:hypothetical protein
VKPQIPGQIGCTGDHPPGVGSIRQERPDAPDGI